MSEAAIQKRKAREEKRRKAAEAAQKAAAEAAGDALFVPEASPASEVPQDTLVNASSAAGIGSSSTSASVPYTVSVPTTSDGFSWYAPEKHTYSTLKAAQDAGIWTYPSTEEEKAKCGVFSDLWHKGYYMGGGSKFGGEWLVYPGNTSLPLVLTSSWLIFTMSYRRPAALSFAFRCHRAIVTECAIASDGGCSSWTVRHCDEEGSCTLWVGP